MIQRMSSLLPVIKSGYKTLHNPRAEVKGSICVPLGKQCNFFGKRMKILNFI